MNDPLVPVEQLAPIDDELVRRTCALPDLALEIKTDPAGIALARATMFELWPELVPGGPLDPETTLYNRYFWFRRFANLWQAQHGEDAGLEQRAFQMVEYADCDVDFEVLTELDRKARDEC
ncbi:MAG: hypothetical protein ACKV2T_31775 [Kofleriaceae bacterium]